MRKYRVLNNTMGKYRCVSLNKEDHCLSGERGEIWEYDSGTYKALVVLPSGQEKIYTFNFKDLGKWVLRLKIPSDPHLQALFANNPNNREQVAKDIALGTH